MAATRRGAEAVSLVMEVGGFSRIMVFINTHHTHTQSIQYSV